MMRDVAFSAAPVVELAPSRLNEAHARGRCAASEAMVVQILQDQRQKAVNIVAFDRQQAVHVEFAERKLCVRH
jgi:hypothetical protein